MEINLVSKSLKKIDENLSIIENKNNHALIIFNTDIAGELFLEDKTINEKLKIKKGGYFNKSLTLPRGYKKSINHVLLKHYKIRLIG